MLGLGDNVLEQVLITECPRASRVLGEQSSTLSLQFGRGPQRGAGQRASVRSWAEGLSAEMMELFQILQRATQGSRVT